MQGKIIKGIAGFYYVYVENKGIYECKAKGKFRNKSIKPLVGDNVMVDIIDEEKKKFTKIGISIHSVEEAKEAERLGASYLTAGHIYATDCKRGLPPRGLGFLKEVCREVSIPVYGIGGIKFDEEQWNDMKKCGAVGGCVMSGMMEI